MLKSGKFVALSLEDVAQWLLVPRSSISLLPVSHAASYVLLAGSPDEQLLRSILEMPPASSTSMKSSNFDSAQVGSHVVR